MSATKLFIILYFEFVGVESNVCRETLHFIRQSRMSVAKLITLWFGFIGASSDICRETSYKYAGGVDGNATRLQWHKNILRNVAGVCFHHTCSTM